MSWARRCGYETDDALIDQGLKLVVGKEAGSGHDGIGAAADGLEMSNIHRLLSSHADRRGLSETASRRMIAITSAGSQSGRRQWADMTPCMNRKPTV